MESIEVPRGEIFIPEKWSLAADSIAGGSPPVTLICGRRNSGKTTFSRYLVNVLLSRYKRVAYLDTDVGQTEFTPPGFVSLVMIDTMYQDMSTASMKTPERCFFYGDISPKRDPTTYLTYVSALYDHYRKHFSFVNNSEYSNAAVPLVINTSGWVKGIGYDLLVDVLKYVSPTHVVKIRISDVEKDLPEGAFWSDEEGTGSTSLIAVNSAIENPEKVRKNAQHLRDMRTITYFRQCFPDAPGITLVKELANALAAQPPFEVSISNVKIKHLHCQVPKTELFYSLNATVVGLAVSLDGSENLSPCVGLGIVRGIDTIKNVLYLLTPVPPTSLEKVDLLLQGLVQIPTDLLQVQGCISPYMATNVLIHKVPEVKQQTSSPSPLSRRDRHMS